MWVNYSSIGNINFGVQLIIYMCIYSPYSKMGYEEILYFFSHGNKSNNAFVFDIVNIPGRISINNTY